MREIRSSGSVEGVVLNHDSYSDLGRLVCLLLLDCKNWELRSYDCESPVPREWEGSKSDNRYFCGRETQVPRAKAHQMRSAFFRWIKVQLPR